LLSQPFPNLPKSVSDRGDLNSNLYLAAEEAILICAADDQFEHAAKGKLYSDGLEDVRQLLANEPEPKWYYSVAWEDLTGKPAPLHEVVQAMELSRQHSQQRISTETRGELNSNSSHGSRSRPHSARMKRPGSNSCSTRPGSSRPSSAGSFRVPRSSSARANSAFGGVWPTGACAISKAVPPKVPMPKERYRIPRQSKSNKPPASVCQSTSPALASRQKLLMQKQHSARVWAAHAAAAQQPAMAETRRCVAFSPVPSMPPPSRPHSAAEGLRRSLQQQAAPGRPALRPPTPRPGGQTPRAGSVGHGPVKAFASAANPRLALLEAARCHAPRAPASRPSTAGTARK